MNKRQMHHVWTKLRKVHPIFLIIVTILFGTSSLLNLRHNNEQMIRLRDAVYAADKDNGNTEAAIRNLRTYVYAHMNTSLTTGPNAVHPPIQLKYMYERLQAAQQAQLQQTNGALYNEAQSYCEQQDSTDFSGRNRVPCIEQYVLSHGATLTPIPDALYKFDFTSARFSLDAAGWSIIATVLSALLTVALMIYRRWAKKNL